MNKVSINKDLYRIQKWGGGYFDIESDGHIVVSPGEEEKSIDLYKLVESLVKKGIHAPLLIRFDGILRDRVHTLCSAFQKAIEDCGYKNTYQPIYPIKVNPKKHVVETIQKAGSQYLLGLEVGCKPELLATLSFHHYPNTLLLCNGFKDAEYIELALLAKKINKRPIIIVEQFHELELILETASRLKIDAEIGLRMKLHAQGSGRWKASGGDHSKFGLSASEITQAVDRLKKANKSHWLKLFHFHIGSQITSLSSIQKGVEEASSMFVHIAKLCPSLCFFDVGGGLAIDYSGAATTAAFSVNYTVEEYAKSVISTIAKACDAASISQPVVLSESGRAMVAHHSVLITEILSASYAPSRKFPDMYFANFSVFQSLPDVWAVGQIFPVMPICRLNEKAGKNATIVDLTCDSDGKIDRFIRKDKPTQFIPLHALNSSPYYVGVFLTGAYQDILGSRHNLFCSTNAVHIDLDKEGNWEIKNETACSSIKEMLAYVHSDPKSFMEKICSAIEKATRENTLAKKESMKIKSRFKKALNGNAYLYSSHF